MKAAMRYRYGPPEVVEVRDIATPAPKADQVLVRVEAAAVNRADLDGLYPRWAFTRLFMGPRTPRQKSVGLDVAGTVEAVGPAATRFKAGDRVFGDMFAFGVGAFAEYVCAPERAFEVTPGGLSFEEAATLPHSAILAIQGLRLRDGRTIKEGDRVLVDGASGNVGPFAVQVAKARGADVTAVASPAKLDFVRSLGADHAVDYTTTDYTKSGERYDWILDAYGAHSMRDVRRALRSQGVHVMLGGPTSRIVESLLLGQPIKLASGKRTGLLIWWKPFNPADVGTLKELLAAGSVRPVIDRRYPLSQVVEALRWVDDGHAKGKVVLTIGERAGE
jgi:NADPH:quinone reductase-like Zn-dependent oxidoreductase